MRVQSKHSAIWAISPGHFALVILEMGAPELFAQAGLELWYTWSQLPK
jgi:hypothetical protein